MEKRRIEFSISFPQQGWNSHKMGNIFLYYQGYIISGRPPPPEPGGRGDGGNKKKKWKKGKIGGKRIKKKKGEKEKIKGNSSKPERENILILFPCLI